MTRRQAVVLAAGCVALVASLLWTPAGAHTWQDHYRHGTYTSRWDVTDIPWNFDVNYWNQGTAFRDRAHASTSTWSNVLANGYVRFRWMETLGSGTYEQCSYNAGTNYLRHASLTGPAATTWYCYRPNPEGDEWSVSGFAITTDSDPAFGDGTPGTWYAGTGTGGSTQVDLASALTHEFGHAAGHATHFDEPDLCPTTAAADHTNAPTMCAGVWYGNDTNRRSLQDHDIHTMQGAYTDPPAPPPTTAPPPGGSGVLKPGCDAYSSDGDPSGSFLPSTDSFSGSTDVAAANGYLRRCI